MISRTVVVAQRSRGSCFTRSTLMMPTRRSIALKHRETRNVMPPDEVIDGLGDGQVWGNRDHRPRHSVPDGQWGEDAFERYLSVAALGALAQEEADQDEPNVSQELPSQRPKRSEHDEEHGESCPSPKRRPSGKWLICRSLSGHNLGS